MLLDDADIDTQTADLRVPPPACRYWEDHSGEPLTTILLENRLAPPLIFRIII